MLISHSNRWINNLARKTRESFALINGISSLSFLFLKEKRKEIK
jgi:hypothetical protein